MASASDAPSAGALLRAAREAAGLSLETLAASLKVSVAKLEALEQDQLDLLPNPVFARALASSVCRVLKVDAAPVLACMPQSSVKFDPPGRGINTPYRVPHAAHGASLWSSLPKPMILMAGALLIGAVGLLVLPMFSGMVGGALPEPRADVAPVSPAPAPVGPAAGTVVDVVVPAEVAPVAGAASPVAAAEGSPPSAVGTPSAPAPAASVPAVPAAPAALAAAPGSLLSFAASGESWVRVADGRGSVVFNRLLKAGDSADVAGALPLTVVVGRADAVQVRLRGQAMNLSQQTRENVARFEVK